MILTLAWVGCLVGGAAACGARAGGADGRPSIVTSVYPLAEAVRLAGGDAVAPIELTPPGAEPHDVELTSDEVVAIAEADAVVYVGGGFQPAVEEAVAEASGPAVDVLEAVATLPAAGAAGSGASPDPHVWLDPGRFAAVVERVAEVLAEVDPGGAARYRAAAADAADDLAALDEAFRAGLARCETRLLVVSHAAFGYLADAYDLRQEAVAGTSPEAEPDPRRLAEIRALVRDEDVTTIFTEPLVSPAVADTLAAETGATTAVLDPLEGLTAERRAAGEDYGSVMRDNLEALRDGLRCG